jgi:hypothetical protein
LTWAPAAGPGDIGADMFEIVCSGATAWVGTLEQAASEDNSSTIESRIFGFLTSIKPKGNTANAGTSYGQLPHDSFDRKNRRVEDGRMEPRLAKLETAVDFIQRDIKELKDDMRAVKSDINSIRTPTSDSCLVRLLQSRQGSPA